jgi:hydrogenase maturation protein HypF
MSVASPRAPVRARIRVEGTVQGVGFRPYIYRLAQETGLSGFVLNDARGVLIEVEGEATAIAAFRVRLEAEAPPLASLDSVSAESIMPTSERGFEIRSSPRDATPDAPVTPDSATCADCLRELFDPADRRFRYPFINCTNCGPRFTIVTSIPYDRPFTTMAGFSMCPRCQAEYDDPANRRFHAQPNACPACGPSLSLHGHDGGLVAFGDAALATAAGALRDGRIVAVKGIGGFHLACRADDEAAVTALRRRKHREDKPFALMVRSLEAAERLVVLSPTERDMLVSSARPIVLARRRGGAPAASEVAPASAELGVMLPYSPLHHILLSDAGLDLVMTSGNVCDEPIAYRDGDALERLRGIAHLFLLHDRPIETRTDDSVVRALDERATVLRRSRGVVPAALPLADGAAAPILGCGAQLKNTFCLAKGRRAWVSHHVGDLENYETLSSYRDGVAHFQRLFAVSPEVIAHDLHPEYLSTKYAFEQTGVELIGVQHHHAHLAACLAEHGEHGPAVGAIYDGSGLGTDGTVWGGELLLGDLAEFRRVGNLRPVRLPGGERAIREPWRMARAWLEATGPEDPALPPTLAGRVDEASWNRVGELARSGLASPWTSSMGRLFDAVAAMCGICPAVSYEGQAAIELEAACRDAAGSGYTFGCLGGEDGLVLDPGPAIRAVLEDVAAGRQVGVIARRFHDAVADITVTACVRLAHAHQTELVVLSGGVFQNRRLLERTLKGLRRAGLRGLIPERLPANDGGISFGQVAVGARRLAEGVQQ